MKYFSSPLLLITVLLSGCTPHPASGVWKTTEDNAYGINKLVVAFDGKANFTTTKIESANWHCFWTASSKFEADLKCTPSTNPDQEESYILTVNDQGLADLQHNAQQIASFVRQDENPSDEN